MRKLGRSGLKVAPICFGGNVFGWTIDQATSFAVLDAYVESGGNFIDRPAPSTPQIPSYAAAHLCLLPPGVRIRFLARVH